MKERIAMMLPLLNEKQKRLFLASEAIAYGRGRQVSKEVFEAISIDKIAPFETWNYRILPVE